MTRKAKTTDAPDDEVEADRVKIDADPYDVLRAMLATKKPTEDQEPSDR
jgi:hypothetical protein